MDVETVLAALVLNLLVLILLRLFESRSVQIVIRSCTSFGQEYDYESDPGEEETDEEDKETPDDVCCAAESSTPAEESSTLTGESSTPAAEKSKGDAKEGGRTEENTK